MEIEIIVSGPLTTIQDLGRIGFRSIGLPTSGAMDSMAARTANLLLGNHENAAVLEITNGDLECMTHTDVLLACTGADAEIYAGGYPLPLYKAIFLPSGTLFRSRHGRRGMRTYLSIAGGFKSEKSLNSFSTYLTAGIGKIVSKGDRLKSSGKLTDTCKTMIHLLQGGGVSQFSWGVYMPGIIDYARREIRVIAGPEEEWFADEALDLFYSSNFTVSPTSGRIAMNMSGASIMRRRKDELLSSPVSMGTIQVTGSGDLIVLMAECQTTGGYPRIGQIAGVDLPVCAQLRSLENIRFIKINIAEAETLQRKQEAEMASLKKRIATIILKL